MNYRYKWVATHIGGMPNSEAIEKATAKGWEAVPTDEHPPSMQTINGLNPVGLKLYRMLEIRAAAKEETRHHQSMLEADPRTHIARANTNIVEYVSELNAEHGRNDAGKGWGKIGGEGVTIVGVREKVEHVPVKQRWHMASD